MLKKLKIIFKNLSRITQLIGLWLSHNLYFSLLDPELFPKPIVSITEILPDKELRDVSSGRRTTNNFLCNYRQVIYYLCISILHLPKKKKKREIKYLLYLTGLF